MNTPGQTDSLNEEHTVEGILRHIEAKSREDDYLFRGEPAHYQEPPYRGKVSSNLYRVFLEREGFDVVQEQFDIAEVQTEMLDTVKEFSRKPVEELERLSEIQHYGGKTNLIDFTEDYLIALFFACDGSPRENGRLILQEKALLKAYIAEPYEPINRVIAQKSVFIEHPDGFIEPNGNDVINIPAFLKKPLREHLDRYHGITPATIYNDIHGFIGHQRRNLELYTEIYLGLAHKRKGDSEHGNPNAA